MKTWHGKFHWVLELRGFKYIGYIRLGGSFWYLCIPNLFTSGSFRLEGPRKGFSPSTSVSSSITHFDIILCLHLFSSKLCALHLLFIVFDYALECYFGFLFNNTFWCYLVFASLFLYSLCFTFTVYCIWLCTRVLF